MKINFIFSNQYESVISQNPVTFEHGNEAVKTMDKLWKKKGPAIEKSLFNITGLRFRTTETPCYINSRASFSEPLSLKIDDPETMLDNLTHELIHVIMTQNLDLIGKKIKAFHKEFESELFVTRIHILVHAIHLMVAKDIFTDRLAEIHDYAQSKEYRKSWDYVRKQGAWPIIEKVFKGSFLNIKVK